MHHPHSRRILPQRLAGMRRRMQHHIFRRAIGHHLATCVATLRPQINQPIRCANHIQVVLNHHQRMTRIQQLAQRTHQLGDVIKVQSRGRLVQHEQRTPLSQKLRTRAFALGSFRQKTR